MVLLKVCNHENFKISEITLFKSENQIKRSTLFKNDLGMVVVLGSKLNRRYAQRQCSTVHKDSAGGSLSL